MTFVPSISILVALAVVNVRFHVSMAAMTRDVAAIANLHPLAGILSNLGILVWCAAASICAFAAIALRNITPRDAFWFLLSSALLSTYLLFDDLFQFHEDLASRYVGVHEDVVFTVLGVVVSAYLITFRRVLCRTNFGMLVLAIGFLGSSVVIDALLEPWLQRWLGHVEFFVEDGAKWLGIVSWCSYYASASHQLLVSAVGVPPNHGIQPDARTSRR